MSKSVITVQRAFRAKDPPADKTVRAWYKQFTETGCLCMDHCSSEEYRCTCVDACVART